MRKMYIIQKPYDTNEVFLLENRALTLVPVAVVFFWRGYIYIYHSLPSYTKIKFHNIIFYKI